MELKKRFLANKNYFWDVLEHQFSEMENLWNTKSSFIETQHQSKKFKGLFKKIWKVQNVIKNIFTRFLTFASTHTLNRRVCVAHRPCREHHCTQTASKYRYVHNSQSVGSVLWDGDLLPVWLWQLWLLAGVCRRRRGLVEVKVRMGKVGLLAAAHIRQVRVGVGFGGEGLLAAAARWQQLPLLRVPPFHPAVLEPDLHLSRTRKHDC